MSSSAGFDSNQKLFRLRESMPALQNKTYFNYGGQGPLPINSLEAIKNSWEEIQRLGPFTNKAWPYMAKEIESTKKYLAQLCGVSRNRIALTENVTTGCVLPLWGLPLNTSERILISDCEHPGVVAACRELARRKQLKIDVLRVQHLTNGDNEKAITTQLLIKELEVSLKPRTKLVVLSHVLWNTGQIMPIHTVSERLSSHPLKPFLLVDAAQSFGQLPIEDAAQAADIYAFTGHKWACGPEGLGGVVVSERVLEESNPTLVGWRSLQQEGSIYTPPSDPFHLDARRFEIATSCIPLLAGLRSSLKLIEREYPKGRFLRIKKLSFTLWQELNQLDGIKTILQGPPPSGLVSFSIINKFSPSSLVQALGEQEIWIRVLEDPIWLRACLHIMTTEEEIITLVETIKNLMK